MPVFEIFRRSASMTRWPPEVTRQRRRQWSSTVTFVKPKTPAGVVSWVIEKWFQEGTWMDQGRQCQI